MKSKLYKLGIKPDQFRKMVESKALFEWSPEIALALGQTLCNWFVIEELEELEDSVIIPTHKSKSII